VSATRSRRTIRRRRPGAGRVVAFVATAFLTVAAVACTPPTTGGTRHVTVTAPSPTMTYGDAPPALTPTYSGLPTGQPQPPTPAVCTTTATSTSPVGTYPVTCSGAAGSGDAFTYVAGTLTVAPAPVVVTASSGSVPVGGPIPAITATYSGLRNGQTEPATLPTCSTTATSTSPTGSYPTTCAGAADPNHSFSYVDGTMTVGTVEVTVTASSSSTVYGDPVPTVVANYSGFQNGQTAPGTLPTCTTTATDTSDVGSYTTSCSGAADANYTFAYVDGTAAITPAPLTITASSTTVGFGSPIPPVTPSYSGLKAGDTAPATPPTCSTTATSSSPAGPYPTTCSGAADPNYTIGYVGGTITITPGIAPVTVTASSATITYGDPIPAVTPSYSGFTGGQTTPATAPTCTTTATATSPVGTYPTSCSGAADPNFTFAYVAGTVTIQRAPATVTASSDSMTYGGTVPTITASYSGLRNGAVAPATLPTCTTTATSTSNTGIYPSTCSGAADPNYTFTAIPGEVGVNKADATVTASSPTMTYGDPPPTIAASYSGLVNGDTAPGIRGATCSTTATAASPVGTYVSTCAGADDLNYYFSYIDGTVTVAAAPVTVTASSPSRAYGAANPAITASYSGLRNGAVAPATLPTCSTTATSTSPVGSYPTSCSGAADPNYTFGYTAGSLSVTKAGPVTVTASSASMVETGSVPTISPSYSGFLFGQAAPATAPTCSTTATSSSPPGSYPSTCSGAADPNYTFAYVAGTVTVTAAPPQGYGAYGTGAHTTTIAAGSNGAAVTSGTINVASASGAGFETYTNLTIQTSNGPQPAFCKGVGATSFTTCSSVGSGTMSTGGAVTTAAPDVFDVYTIIPGGKTAVQPSSVTIVTDVPAADRAMPTWVAANASNALVSYVPSANPTGTFSLTFGYCATGTATYSAGNPACATAQITYGPTVSSNMGAAVQVSIITENLYEKVGTYVVAPATVPQGSTFTSYVAPAAASVPKLQDSGTFLGDVTVNNASVFTAIVPIPAGMTYVSSKLIGGDARTAGVATLTYCTAASSVCNAKTTGNFTWTTYPYLKETLPTGSVPGGGTITMPSVAVTLQATGAAGTVANTSLTEFLLTTSTSLATVTFDGYPTSGSADVTPPKAPPAVLASTTITP
jgi:hypothetical protein